MNVLLIKMEGSPFNCSIWNGFSSAFHQLGHDVTIANDSNVPPPSELSTEPELVLAVHGGTVPVEKVTQYRERGVPAAVHLLDEPYEVDRSTRWARHYDWVFTVDRVTVGIHREHSRASFLPLAYDADVFRRDGRAYPSDILVLGSPFDARLNLLAPLRRRWGKHVTWVGRGWQSFCPDGRHVEQFVSPEICARFYRGAKIVINIHRDPLWSHFGEHNRRGLLASHLNPRVWEATGCGAFQLCTHRSDLTEFAPDMVSFDTTERLDQLLEFHLDNDQERQKTAERVYHQIEPHTYLARVLCLLSTMGFDNKAAKASTNVEGTERNHLSPNIGPSKGPPRQVDKKDECRAASGWQPGHSVPARTPERVTFKEDKDHG